MGKKKKNKDNIPEGMSRRQAKLAARAAERAALEPDPRPFGGFPCETDLVAMQVFVPSAYAEATLIDGSAVTLATVLPGAVAGMIRDDARFVALQTQTGSINPGRDLAYQLAWAKDAASGATLAKSANDGSQLALKDILASVGEITVASDFNWWIAEDTPVDATYRQAIDRASAAILPSEKVNAEVEGSAWWVDAGDKAHIRWLVTYEEEALLKALARVGAAGELNLGPDTKFAGVFRTHGLIVPVFDLDPTVGAQEFAPALEAVAAKLKAAFNDEELSPAERRYLENIKSRQVTIR